MQNFRTYLWGLLSLVSIGVFAQDAHPNHPFYAHSPRIEVGLTPTFYRLKIYQTSASDSVFFTDLFLQPRLQIGIRYGKRSRVELFGDFLHRKITDTRRGNNFTSARFGIQQHWFFKDIVLANRSKEGGIGKFKAYPNFYIGLGTSNLKNDILDPELNIGDTWNPLYQIGTSLSLHIYRHFSLEFMYFLEYEPAIKVRMSKPQTFNTKIVYRL